VEEVARGAGRRRARVRAPEGSLDLPRGLAREDEREEDEPGPPAAAERRRGRHRDEGRREDLQRARSEEKPETDPVRQKRLEAALAREALQGAPPTRDSSRQAPAPVVSDWVNRKSRRIGGDGKAAFTDLPPGEEFRLAIVRQGERYESSSGLYLRPDQLAVAKARVPAPSTATAEVVMPLPLTWQSRPLTPDERPAGISWSIR